MSEEKFIMFRNRLQKVYRHLSRQAKRLNVSCFRVYDHDLPEFPFCIEIYDNNVYVAEYKRNHQLTDEEHECWTESSRKIITEVTGVGADHIFMKLRQRKPGRMGQYQKIADHQHEFEVEENGLRFLVNLTDYLDTGLFLDHRTTRQMVKDASGGKRVLNLFAYTGSFSVYAAAGEASSVTTIDLSGTYTKWAERNMFLNGYRDPVKYRFIQADVLGYLDQSPGRFDIIILDPPTFSNSKKMEGFLDIQRDHVSLINKCLELLDENGQLYFSTNFTRFQMESEKLTAQAVKDISRQTTPFDFEGKLKRWCYLLFKV